MDTWAVACLLGAAATVALTLRKRGPRLIALVVATGVLISQASIYTLGWNQAQTINTAFDIIAAAALVFLWWFGQGRPPWLFAVALLFLFQVLTHYAYADQPLSLSAWWCLYVSLWLQFAVILLNDRVDRIWDAAADAFGRGAPRPRRRIRSRGVVARADAIIVRIGARALREKSR